MSSRPEVDIQTPYTKDVISSKKPLYDPKLTKFFPSIVHGMVSESDDSIIAWLEHGEAFIVGSMDKIGAVLEKYFQHDKYSSFQRQLNMYGWKKYTHGKYKGAFHHPFFHEDINKSNFSLIRRKAPPNETTRKRKQSFPTIPPSCPQSNSGYKNKYKYQRSHEYKIQYRVNDKKDGWASISRESKIRNKVLSGDEIQIGSPKFATQTRGFRLHMTVNKDSYTLSSTVVSPLVVSKSIASNRISMLATTATYVRNIEVRTGLFST